MQPLYIRCIDALVGALGCVRVRHFCCNIDILLFQACAVNSVMGKLLMLVTVIVSAMYVVLLYVKLEITIDNFSGCRN